MFSPKCFRFPKTRIQKTCQRSQPSGHDHAQTAAVNRDKKNIMTRTRKETTRTKISSITYREMLCACCINLSIYTYNKYMCVYYIHLTLDRGATYDDCLLLQRVIVCVFSEK